MRIALEVWSNDFDEVRATCLRAESLGIDGFYYGESPHGLNIDCWTTLAGLAPSTKRIRLGPVITNMLPTYRSVVLMARQAATVAAIAPGRIDFRTGVGAAPRFARPWWEPFGVDYPPYDQRLADLTRALEALPGLWNDIGVPPLPITVAARGRRAMRLAADHADVWETSFATPAECADRLMTIREMAPDRRIQPSLEIDGFVSTTATGVGQLVDRVRRERGAAEDLEPVFERALIGTPDQVARQLDALATSGVEQVVIALHDPHDADALEAVAEAARQHNGAVPDR